MIPKDSKRFQKIPESSKSIKKSKRIQRILEKAIAVAKHSTVLAGWPKKLISSPNPPEFKELDAPALLGCLKRFFETFDLG